ncbi:hypothetical protein D6851_02425 [Altericroceibacterium spongiae]|uniref:Nucleotidyltransferase n=1 Tax=Altericroceibacterium spongiae TaxID=2320269 RepID=A0A420ERP6_9SPHN|nr:hypothetical protein [Altericroceibacterium spongiae]RKF23347.1 hypothetical protein D6851_02425 [Altericroceibacterium spongiae]
MRQPPSPCLNGWTFPDHYTDAACHYTHAVRTAEISIFCERALPAVRAAARECGYALAIHGSQQRDLDIVAIPWTEEATNTERLLNAIARAVHDETGWGHWHDQPALKPHGRVAYTITASAEVHIDLSIMPRSGQPPSSIFEREHV